MANILAVADSVILSDTISIEALGTSIEPLIECVKQTQSKPKRLYGASALANASGHPRLMSLINQNGGLQLFRDIDRQCKSNLHTIGSRLGECAQTAIHRLSDRREGDPNFAQTKYT